jgi:hypothetical protein
MCILEEQPFVDQLPAAALSTEFITSCLAFSTFEFVSYFVLRISNFPSIRRA